MDLDTYTPDRLLAGNAQAMTKEVVIKTGVGVVLARGTVLGAIKIGAVPATGTAGGGNTGNGTMGSVAGKRRTKAGVYTATAVSAGTNQASFEVKNPDGKVLGIALTGVAFVSDEINFTIADGGTDFVVGDTFTVTVPAATTDLDKGKVVDKDNIDGSGTAVGVLAEAVDATAADVTTIMYITGQFNRAALVVGATDTIADHEADLRTIDIHLKDVVAA